MVMWTDIKQQWYSRTSKENLQWYGENIFVQVMDKVTIRLFFSQAAFLYGEMLQEIYVVLSDELRIQEKIEVIAKSLYGTPGAHQIWYTVFSEKFSTLQLKQRAMDPCLFFSKNMDIWIIVYVNDSIIAPKTTEAQQPNSQPKQLKPNSLSISFFSFSSK